MTLIVPNGMTFSVGSSNTAGGDSSMGKTLDEMIKNRRTDQVKSKRAPKKSSNSDLSMATGRAKREAATKARRGITQDKKPNAVEIEREVYRQTRKTAAAKKKTQKKATGGRLAPDSSLRSKKQNPAKESAPAAVFGGRVPPKKAVEAAVKGMEAAGFKIPTGHQVVMTFIPVATAEKKTEKNAKGKATSGQKNNKNKNKGDGRRKKK